MNIEELIAGLKEKGMSDEQIKEELMKLKADIEKHLTPEPAPEPAPATEPEESDEEKQHRVFGL